ncbi:MAG: hypothetical protein ACLQHS_02920 [Candidatus Limnocylindrales bacterium]|jgi:hypothetical protein
MIYGTIVVNRDTADWMQLGFIGPRVVPDTDMTAIPSTARIASAEGVAVPAGVTATRDQSPA